MEVLFWNFLLGVEEDYEKPENSRCLGPNSNRSPPDYKSVTLPLRQPVRRFHVFLSFSRLSYEGIIHDSHLSCHSSVYDHVIG
jgi:hypothetical protein